MIHAIFNLLPQRPNDEGQMKMSEKSKRPAYLVFPALIGIGSLTFLPVGPATAESLTEDDSTAESAENDFADISDFEALGELSEQEQEALISALEEAPEDIQRSEDPQELYDHLVENVEGVDGGPSTQALPLVIVAARAVACLGPSYAALRNISEGSADAAAASIAGAIAGCVTGGGATVIKNAILNNRAMIAQGLRVIGLSGLALTLTGDTPQTASYNDRPLSVDPASTYF